MIEGGARSATGVDGCAACWQSPHSATGAIVAALDGADFDVVPRDRLAADATAAAVPSLAKYRGLVLVVDIKATQRER